MKIDTGIDLSINQLHGQADLWRRKAAQGNAS